jgi:hypothetical protein
VRIDLEPNEAEGTTSLSITVNRERFSTPGRQVNNSMAAFRMFGYDLPAVSTGKQLSPADDEWIPDGHDPAMELYLLKRIMAQAQPVF